MAALKAFAPHLPPQPHPTFDPGIQPGAPASGFVFPAGISFPFPSLGSASLAASPCGAMKHGGLLPRGGSEWRDPSVPLPLHHQESTSVAKSKMAVAITEVQHRVKCVRACSVAQASLRVRTGSLDMRRTSRRAEFSLLPPESQHFGALRRDGA
ncbi:hypothetical protein ZHAS_00003999 [Anopheles sinensis]|uniref:Uncharacterized protein n=1 Tax=Anopheles sinensis TaxID=74873 RepID=A0A084VFU0_ANOSI|nr:hypothetical protein ZHAS_00003999 [Anopheles sinensis]